jgi:hypothetical protein
VSDVGTNEDSLHCLVRPSITSDQRRDFRRWSEAINQLDDPAKADEGEAWIAAAMAILERMRNDAQRTGCDFNRGMKVNRANNFC